ncbi:MAG TPA: CBS domain-containing protein [Alphaproteobacteria bacterium]|jgi:CBS domain-containing protein
MASRDQRFTKRPGGRRLVARDIMSRDPICVTEQTSLADCARLMRGRGLGALPVIDSEREVIGMVSDGDLLRAAASDGQPKTEHWMDLLGAPEAAAGALATLASRRAADVMTKRVICVRPDMPVGEVATILDEWRIKRAPVLADGRIVGIVSRSDLLRTMLDPRRLRPEIAASDSSIRDSLVAHLKQLTWLEGGGVQVTVNDGTVVLYGFAASSEEVVAIEYLAEGVPGVRFVENYLRVGQHTKYRN